MRLPGSLPRLRPGRAGHGAAQDHAHAPPGTYGAVVLPGRGAGRGHLVLSGGSYVFCSLRAGRNAEIRATGAAAVAVDGDVELANATFVGPSSGGGTLSLFANGSRVHFSRQSEVHATLCAPNATLFLTEGAHLSGRFVARRIRAEHVTGVKPVKGTTTTTTKPPKTTTSTTTYTTSTTTTTIKTKVDKKAKLEATRKRARARRHRRV